MIGGYLYSQLDMDFDHCFQKALPNTFFKIDIWENGYLFYDEPFHDRQTNYSRSDKLILLSQDLLVKKNNVGEYELLDIQKDFPELFIKKGPDSLNHIISDFRMVIFDITYDQGIAYLISNRAGAGRVYYHQLQSGIVFSTDLRFLLKFLRFDVNEFAIYAICKYGAIPEPITINETISAVPPAHYLKYDLKTNQLLTQPYFKFRFTSTDNQNIDNNIPAMLKPVKDALLRSAKFLSNCQPSVLISGGIDSSLYASYLKEAGQDHFKAIYCKFEGNDPEFKFAEMIAERIDTDLHVGKMHKDDAMTVLEDVVSLTDHPFSDFSSLPITFILGFLKAHLPDQTAIIECNGGDDCFGFPALALQKKFILKNNFPKLLKDLISFLFKNSTYWKWESKLGILARILALSDVHETNLLNYFLVSTPINFLDLNKNKEWDNTLTTIMDNIFSNCGEDYNTLGYEARTTIRQLLHINSRKWTAKAFSVGESLGIRVIYPFIWLDILAEQGKLPWNLKVYNGIVKWPLKKLLEEFMPNDFIYRKKSGFVPPFVLWLTSPDFNAKVRDILLSQNGHITRIVPKKIFDELLSDALKGRELRSGILSLLWGALFTEMWIQKYKSDSSSVNLFPSF